MNIPNKRRLSFFLNPLVLAVIAILLALGASLSALCVEKSGGVNGEGILAELLSSPDSSPRLIDAVMWLSDAPTLSVYGYSWDGNADGKADFLYKVRRITTLPRHGNMLDIVISPSFTAKLEEGRNSVYFRKLVSPSLYGKLYPNWEGMSYFRWEDDSAVLMSLAGEMPSQEEVRLSHHDFFERYPGGIILLEFSYQVNNSPGGVEVAGVLVRPAGSEDQLNDHLQNWFSLLKDNINDVVAVVQWNGDKNTVYTDRDEVNHLILDWISKAEKSKETRYDS